MARSPLKWTGKKAELYELLGAIGGLVGGGMAAGLGLLIGVPALAGGAVYGITKVVKKRRGR